jgi:DNA-binding PadR family transcriptional regulator
MDVRILCLGVLSQRDCSGYEIRKAFEEGPFSHFQDAGFGSIYPALKRLVDDGMVAHVEQQPAARPDKKVYRITPLGRQALFEAVGGDAAPDKLRSDFLFMVYFADLLTPRRLDRLIADRLALHRAVLERLEGCEQEAAPGETFVRGFGVAVHRAAIDYLERHGYELVGALLQRKVAE